MTTLWRYQIPSENGEGWAIFVIGSDGFFATVNDYHNCAFRWTDPGVKDFREFFLDVKKRKDYFIEKLSGGRHVHNAHLTLMAVFEALRKLNDREIEESERRVIRNEYGNLSDEGYLRRWADNTMAFDPHDAWALQVMTPPHMVHCLVTAAMPKMEVLIRAEFAHELRQGALKVLALSPEELAQMHDVAKIEGIDFYKYLAAFSANRSIHTITDGEREFVKKYMFSKAYGKSGEDFLKAIK